MLDADFGTSRDQEIFNLEELNNSEMPVIFNELPNDISLQEEVIACNEELADMIEDNDISLCYKRVENGNASPEAMMENPSNQLIQAELEAAVKSIHTFPESSIKSHIIEEKKKVLMNFFTNLSNYEREDEDKTDDGMITIDSLLELYKVIKPVHKNKLICTFLQT